jgi:hypothetical protein
MGKLTWWQAGLLGGFALSVALGLFGGAWIGRDIRKEIAIEGQPNANGPEPPQR